MANKKKSNQNSKGSFNNKKGPYVEDGVFIYSGAITVAQFCKGASILPKNVIAFFLKKGIILSLNSLMTDDQIAEYCLENDMDIKKEEAFTSDDLSSVSIFSEESDKDVRCPVVTIMGHVDHGKTTLIDNIRHSNIAGGEHGGITQQIGAYQKMVNGKKITFIDTPGHEAFTAMRARGTSVTDIVVLVVAADDGVKPQTIEAINHAKAANVPIIVAINKIDKPEADIERTKSGLSNYGLLCEEWGGDVMMFPISAKKNIGVDKLLEGILDLAELLELKANDDRPAIGSVIEAKLDKKEGAKATLLVQNGTLHVGDYLAVGEYYCKVRKMTNEYDNSLKVAGPSTPVQVTGLSGVPVAGDRFLAFPSEKEARAAADKKANANIMNNAAVTLANAAQNADNNGNVINLIIKSDTQGTAETIANEVAKIKVGEMACRVIHCASGDVTQSDVTLANASKAVIIAFSVKVSSNIKDEAKAKKVEIREYNIIYHLTEDLYAALEGMLEPTYEEVIYGHAEVRSLFQASKVGQIAGCYVTDGKVTNSSKIRVYRNKELVLSTHLSSLKRFKDDAKEVLTGFDCGLTISDKFELQEHDILEAYGMEVVKNGK